MFNINRACPSVRTYQIAAGAEPGEANYTAGSGRSQLCGRRVGEGLAKSSEVVAESGRSRCADNREGERSAEEVSGTRGRRLGAGLGTRVAGEESRWRPTRVSAGHTGLSVCMCLGLSGQDLENVSRAAMAAGEEKRFPATGHRSVPADPQLPQSGQAATVSAVRGEDRASHC